MLEQERQPQPPKSPIMRARTMLSFFFGLEG